MEVADWWLRAAVVGAVVIPVVSSKAVVVCYGVTTGHAIGLTAKGTAAETTRRGATLVVSVTSVTLTLHVSKRNVIRQVR